MGSKASKKTSKNGTSTETIGEEDPRLHAVSRDPSPYEIARENQRQNALRQKERAAQHAAFESARLSHEPEQFPNVLDALFQPSSVRHLSRDTILAAHHNATDGGDEGLWYTYRDVGRRLSRQVDAHRADTVHFCTAMFDDLPWWLRRWCLPLPGDRSGKRLRRRQRIDPPSPPQVPTRAFLCDALGATAAQVYAIDAALGGDAYVALRAQRSTIGFRVLRLEMMRIISFLRPSRQQLALVGQPRLRWIPSLHAAGIGERRVSEVDNTFVDDDGLVHPNNLPVMGLDAYGKWRWWSCLSSYSLRSPRSPRWWGGECQKWMDEAPMASNHVSTYGGRDSDEDTYTEESEVELASDEGNWGDNGEEGDY